MSASRSSSSGTASPTPDDEADLHTDTPDLDADAGEFDDPGDDPEVEVAPELVFTTKKKDRPAPGELEKIPFEVDGEIYYSVRPTDEALVFLTTASSRGLSDGDRFNAILQFCGNALDHDSSNRITQRFLDRDDDFGFEELLDVLKAIAKAWGRRKGGGTGRGKGSTRRRGTTRRR